MRTAAGPPPSARARRAHEAGSARPIFITEFGQGDCGAGECYEYAGTYDGEAMSYTEAITTIANAEGVSWMPWAWKPSMAGRRVALPVAFVLLCDSFVAFRPVRLSSSAAQRVFRFS